MTYYLHPADISLAELLQALAHLGWPCEVRGPEEADIEDIIVIWTGLDGLEYEARYINGERVF